MGTYWNVKKERQDGFLADGMLLCSGDHIIAVIYYLCSAEGVLYRHSLKKSSVQSHWMLGCCWQMQRGRLEGKGRLEGPLLPALHYRSLLVVPRCSLGTR